VRLSSKSRGFSARARDPLSSIMNEKLCSSRARDRVPRISARSCPERRGRHAPRANRSAVDRNIGEIRLELAIEIQREHCARRIPTLPRCSEEAVSPLPWRILQMASPARNGKLSAPPSLPPDFVDSRALLCRLFGASSDPCPDKVETRGKLAWSVIEAARAAP